MSSKNNLTNYYKVPKVSSIWIKKVNSGIYPSNNDLIEHLDIIHKCYAGFTVSGDNVGVNESISVSGEALSFLSTGIDTRVYYIKNF